MSLARVQRAVNLRYNISGSAIFLYRITNPYQPFINDNWITIIYTFDDFLLWFMNLIEKLLTQNGTIRNKFYRWYSQILNLPSKQNQNIFWNFWSNPSRSSRLVGEENSWPWMVRVNKERQSSLSRRIEWIFSICPKLKEWIYSNLFRESCCSFCRQWTT